VLPKERRKEIPPRVRTRSQLWFPIPEAEHLIQDQLRKNQKVL
jgi:hypothetical protein